MKPQKNKMKIVKHKKEIKIIMNNFLVKPQIQLEIDMIQKTKKKKNMNIKKIHQIHQVIK